MIDPVVEATVRLGLALLVVSAVYHKLADFEHFVSTVADYQLMPGIWARSVAVILVFGEMMLAASLVLVSGPIVGVAAAVLFLSYGLAMAINLLRGRAGLDCGCTGSYGRPGRLSWGLVTRNACLASVAIVVCMPVSHRPLAWMDVTVVAAVLTCSAFIYLSLDLLIRQFQVSRDHLEKTAGN